MAMRYQNGTLELEDEIIRSCAKNNLNLNKVAKELGYKRSTIGYHCDRIKQRTGKDPRNFYDLLSLLGYSKFGKRETSGMCIDNPSPVYELDYDHVLIQVGPGIVYDLNDQKYYAPQTGVI